MDLIMLLSIVVGFFILLGVGAMYFFWKVARAMRRETLQRRCRNVYKD